MRMPSEELCKDCYIKFVCPSVKLGQGCCGKVFTIESEEINESLS